VVARAIALSLAVHVLVLSLLAVLWPTLRGAEQRPPPAWLMTALVEPSLPSPTEVARLPLPATEIDLLRAPGDTVVDVARPGAPTPAPNPDPQSGAAAASSGGGPGAPTLVTARADAATLRVQPYDAPREYQLQRIRTGEQRVSREQVRATPHPDATPWLSSVAHGDGHAEADRRLTAVASTVTPARPDDPDRAPPRVARDERAGFARPDVARDPAATDAAEPSQDVGDRVQQALVSDEKQPAPLELSRPASPGEGTRGQGDSPAALGYQLKAAGTTPVPAGAPNLPTARTLALATFQRAYDHYLSRVKQKVDPLWEFPRELALALEQGDVLVGFTIRKDGTVRDVRVLKASGFPKFDKNVVAAIRKASPFEPLPETLGAELHVTAPFEGSNPAIR
jgi:TonB family protein